MCFGSRWQPQDRKMRFRARVSLAADDYNSWFLGGEVRLKQCGLGPLVDNFLSPHYAEDLLTDSHGLSLLAASVFFPLFQPHRLALLSEFTQVFHTVTILLRWSIYFIV